MENFYASYASTHLLREFGLSKTHATNHSHPEDLVTVKVGSAQLPHHKWRKKKFGSAGKKCGGS